MTQVHDELRVFRSFATRASIGSARCEALGEDAFVMRSPRRRALRPDRSIDLCLLGLTHGNEVAGIAILNDVLRLIDAAEFDLCIDVAFVLGNVPAYLGGQRFKVSDLNRAFGRTDTGNDEQRRARFIETIFLQSAFVIDYHQTQSKAESPFYISLFDAPSFLAFSRLMPRCEIVTYWEAAFSTDGMTTINYQIAKGGHGFGIELGTKGFETYQIELGVSLALKMIESLSLPGFLQRLLTNPIPAAAVFTWNDVVKSKTGNFALIPGLANMAVIEQGMLLGSVDGLDYHAKTSGRLLFPKYPQIGERVAPGAEVCRILRSVTQSEIVAKLDEGAVEV